VRGAHLAAKGGSARTPNPTCNNRSGEAELSGPFAKYLVLGLGLLFLGKQETVEATAEIAKTLSERISRRAGGAWPGLAWGRGRSLSCRGTAASAEGIASSKRPS
jgi:hypothetical protein